MLITAVETVDKCLDRRVQAVHPVDPEVDDLRRQCGAGGEKWNHIHVVCHQVWRGSPGEVPLDPLNDPQLCPQVWVPSLG